MACCSSGQSKSSVLKTTYPRNPPSVPRSYPLPALMCWHYATGKIARANPDAPAENTGVCVVVSVQKQRKFPHHLPIAMVPRSVYPRSLVGSFPPRFHTHSVWCTPQAMCESPELSPPTQVGWFENPNLMNKNAVFGWTTRASLSVARMGASGMNGTETFRDPSYGVGS